MEVKIGDYNVLFPYEPYPAQKSYMEKVIKCMDEKQFGLLESPTGTGKTLALLCSSLAWLEAKGRTLTSAGSDADIKALLRGEGVSNEAMGFLSKDNVAGGAPPRCRIVYASRTHSQLSQVIEEFRRSPYNSISSVILASRDQLCINESLASFQDKNQMCKVKRQSKTCAYYNNMERASDTQPESGIGDIESLRLHGFKRKLCPYYISRDMAAKADIIFLPYNYLVDPRIRKSLAINLEECVVIVDEAHNIMRVFEDASSASFTAKDIALALSECDFVLDFQSKAAQEDVYTDTLSNMPNIDTSQVYALKDCLTNFEKGIVELSQKMSNAGNYTGEEVIRIFESCGVTSGNASLLCTAINAVMDGLSVLNMASGTNKGKGLAAMNELVEMLYLDGSVIKAEEKMKSFYRFHVSQVESKFGKGKDTQFNLWCFHPGFSLNSLVRCNIRTLILTSGTLKPMNSFQNELGAKFSVQLQNGHVINAEKQINYQVISNGPDGQELISTFASRSNVKYLSSLGQSLVEIAKVVPDGLLVFFPSYAWMDTYLAHWKQIGIWERLNHWKQCFVEPKDRSTLAKTVDEFRTKVRHVSRIGACFLAVCRGKVSEGIDFADADARAVVITGIPFPSVYDPKVSLKKKFLDSQKSSNGDSSSAGGLSGAEWYNLEAFRAINQAVGRVIRHKDDFGAVLLLDKRFAMEANTSKLSSWLPKANKSKDFKASVKSLENFFSQHQYVPKKPKVLQPVAVQMQNKKRPTTCVSSQTVMEQAAKGPPPKRQRIVIKSRVTPSSSTDDSSENPSSIPAAMTKEDETKSRVNSHRPQASADIQCFVLRLKERLEKKELKNFIGKVREYKEQGNIAPLAEQIKSYSQRKLIHQGDVSDFRPFVRQADVKTFDAILLCDDGKE